MLPSLSPVSCCLCYRAVFALLWYCRCCVLSYMYLLCFCHRVLSCCLSHRAVFGVALSLLCAVRSLVSGVLYKVSRCLCHRTERHLLICTLLSSFSLLLCDCSVLVIALSSASPCVVLSTCSVVWFHVFLCFFVPIRKCCSLPLRNPENS